MSEFVTTACQFLDLIDINTGIKEMGDDPWRKAAKGVVCKLCEVITAQKKHARFIQEAVLLESYAYLQKLNEEEKTEIANRFLGIKEVGKDGTITIQSFDRTLYPGIDAKFDFESDEEDLADSDDEEADDGEFKEKELENLPEEEVDPENNEELNKLKDFDPEAAEEFEEEPDEEANANVQTGGDMRMELLKGAATSGSIDPTNMALGAMKNNGMDPASMAASAMGGNPAASMAASAMGGNPAASMAASALGSGGLASGGMDALQGLADQQKQQKLMLQDAAVTSPTAQNVLAYYKKRVKQMLVNDDRVGAEVDNLLNAMKLSAVEYLETNKIGNLGFMLEPIIERVSFAQKTLMEATIEDHLRNMSLVFFDFISDPIFTLKDDLKRNNINQEDDLVKQLKRCCKTFADKYISTLEQYVSVSINPYKGAVTHKNHVGNTVYEEARKDFNQVRKKRPITDDFSYFYLSGQSTAKGFGKLYSQEENEENKDKFAKLTEIAEEKVKIIKQEVTAMKKNFKEVNKQIKTDMQNEEIQEFAARMYQKLSTGENTLMGGYSGKFLTGGQEMMMNEKDEGEAGEQAAPEPAGEATEEAPPTEPLSEIDTIKAELDALKQKEQELLGQLKQKEEEIVKIKEEEDKEKDLVSFLSYIYAINKVDKVGSDTFKLLKAKLQTNSYQDLEDKFIAQLAKSYYKKDNKEHAHLHELDMQGQTPRFKELYGKLKEKASQLNADIPVEEDKNPGVSPEDLAEFGRNYQLIYFVIFYLELWTGIIDTVIKSEGRGNDILTKHPTIDQIKHLFIIFKRYEPGRYRTIMLQKLFSTYFMRKGTAWNAYKKIQKNIQEKYSVNGENKKLLSEMFDELSKKTLKDYLDPGVSGRLSGKENLLKPPDIGEILDNEFDKIKTALEPRAVNKQLSRSYNKKGGGSKNNTPKSLKINKTPKNKTVKIKCL